MSVSGEAVRVRDRWVGVGHDAGVGSVAGQRAAVLALDGRQPSLVVVFCSPLFDLGAVGAAVRGVAGSGVPIVGCTTAGEISGAMVGSGGVVVMALGGEGLAVGTAVGRLSDGPRAAGAAAAAAITGIDSPHRVLMMLNEGLAGDRLAMLRGAYSVAGAAVPLVGGCAGDDFAMRETRQLFGEEVLTQAVIGVAIGSPAPIGVGIGHGFRRMGEPMVVTDSTTDRVLRLDDEPALDVYLTRMNAAPSAFEDPSILREIASHHALGLERAGGEELRAVLGADFGERSLTAADVPEGSMLWVMEGDADSVRDGVAVACDEALGMLEGRDPIGLIAFDCLGRRMILGEDGIRGEIALIAGCAPGVPLAGFYTYGEIARVRGSRGIHSATLVLLALG